MRMPESPCERRLHPRTVTLPMFLMVAGYPARLLDWSFGGLRVRLELPASGLLVGMAVDITVLRADGGSWSHLPATIRHLGNCKDGSIGLELLDRPHAFPILLELLNDSIDPLPSASF
ncbi:PilZ domain-containing protein [Niveispirillum sp. BGYR6]|uniref:PilZ domain-containing protein n=1 Tax=Niveispirillum sp. BGYR6 TaxID=2971249 RepID=UPI0022B97226|nr:PilZ domain-containing protein [Niveispirillum sp. BGYR6]MDG5497982.1 PilZ domain-containing protein [Niveispirillum sp. BGYR6]